MRSQGEGAGAPPHPGALPLTRHTLLARAALRQAFLSLDPRAYPRAPQVSPSGPVIPYASVKPGRTGQDGDAGVRRSKLSVCNPPDHAGCWGSTPAPSPCAPSLAVRPLVTGPWARVSLLTRVAPSHCGRDIPGRHDPATGLRRDPLGSAAVHAGPGPSSYTTHVRQVPLGGAQVWGGSRAPAGFRVGAGHGALIETSLTRGGVAAQAHRGPNGSH